MGSPSSAIDVLYEDNHLIAVFKPGRVLTQGDETGDFSLFEATKHYLKEKYHKPGNVYLGLLHRLDRPACGVVLFAKTSKAASRLSEQIRTRDVLKTYRAVVEGDRLPNAGTLVHYIEPTESGAVKIFAVPQSNAKRAELDYKVLARQGGRSLLEVDLKTGRKHQIRAQLADLGFPILGDAKYGARDTFERGQIALMAYSLAFSHPVSKENINISVPEKLKAPVFAL